MPDEDSAADGAGENDDGPLHNLKAEDLNKVLGQQQKDGAGVNHAIDFLDTDAFFGDLAAFKENTVG